MDYEWTTREDGSDGVGQELYRLRCISYWSYSKPCSGLRFRLDEVGRRMKKASFNESIEPVNRTGAIEDEKTWNIDSACVGLMNFFREVRG